MAQLGILQVLGDYANYLSTLSTVTFFVALFIITPLGLFLCRYSTKFIVISIIGLAWVTIYLSQSTIGVVHLFETTGRSLAGLLLQYAFPPVFFLAAAIGAISYGLQISTRSRKDNQLPIASPKGGPGFRERWSVFFHWFATREGIAICIIAAVVLTVHLVYIVNCPSHTIGDEVYYVPEANRFLHGQSMAIPEHPPLAKCLIAAGIFIFGNNAVGWRAFSILFGIAAIFIFYLICVRLMRHEPASTGQFTPSTQRGSGWFQGTTFVPILAVFLFAFENMSFVTAHVAMLDVFYVTFMLLGFLLYLRGNYLSCGVAMGLSLLCKETALLAILAIVLHWAVTRRSEFAAEIRYTWNELQGKEPVAAPPGEISSMFKLLAAVSVTWIVLLVPLEYRSIHQYPATTYWFNPICRTTYMVWHLMLNTFTEGSTAGIPIKPWLWPISPSVIGWTVWALIIPATVYLIYQAVRDGTKGHDLAVFSLCWLVGVYGLLIVMELTTDRLTYLFYFYPAIPAVCLAIAWGVWKLWGVARRRQKTRVVFLTGLVTYLLGTVATFIIIMSRLTLT